MNKFFILFLMIFALLMTFGCANNNPIEQQENIIYKNSVYNFTLEFPESWEGFITKDRILSPGLPVERNSIDFGFPIQEALFNISMPNRKQWELICSEQGPKQTYIGENDQYIFGYGSAQYAENEEMIERMKEILIIIETFKAE